MKAFVINLAAATERMERMQGVFAQAGIAITRFDAVDQKRAALHPIKGCLPPMQRRPWAPSEIGCLLSHYEIWRLIAEGNDAFATIFEDDLHIRPGGLNHLLASPPPAGADVIKIETVFSPVKLGVFVPHSVPIRRLSGLHLGCGAYIISRRAAKQLANKPELFDLPVDHLLFEPRHPASENLVRYQCFPALAVQDSVLPETQRLGSFLQSDMPGRPAASPRPPKGSLLSRAIRGPVTLFNVTRAAATRIQNYGSVVVPF